MTDREKFALALLALSTEHKISNNSQGGYDCKCGSRWDWQSSEKRAADLHVALFQADQLIAAGYGEI